LNLNAFWYAVQVRPKHEFAIAHHLNNLSVENYLPVREVTAFRAMQGNSKFQPLFPGYLFVRLDLGQGPRLYSVPGVVRMLGCRGIPIPIGDREIETIRSILTCSSRVQTLSPIKCGDEVTVCSGPLTGIRGTFLRAAAGNMLVISLPLLQRSLAVTLPTEWVITPGGLQSPDRISSKSASDYYA